MRFYSSNSIHLTGWNLYKNVYAKIYYMKSARWNNEKNSTNDAAKLILPSIVSKKTHFPFPLCYLTFFFCNVERNTQKNKVFLGNFSMLIWPFFVFSIQCESIYDYITLTMNFSCCIQYTQMGIYIEWIM